MGAPVQFTSELAKTSNLTVPVGLGRSDGAVVSAARSSNEPPARIDAGATAAVISSVSLPTTATSAGSPHGDDGPA